MLTLKLFLAVVAEGNMMRAAGREHITISAVSRRIAALESRAGVKLLERNERGVKPTAVGLELARGAQRVFDLLDNVALGLNAHKTGAAGVVRVHAHMSAMTTPLAESIAAFRSLHPAVEVVLEEETSLEVIAAVNSGDAEIGFISGTVEAAGLNACVWMKDELVAVLPKNHPLSNSRHLHLQEMLSYPFITMQRGSALVALFERAARRLGRPLLPCAYLANFASVRLMVAAGLGVAILPEASIGIAEEAITTVPLAESWAVRELNICSRERQRLNTAAQLLLDHFLRQASGNR